MKKRIIIFILMLCMRSLMAATSDIHVDTQAGEQFINKMVNEYHFSRGYVSDLIYNSHLLPAVIQDMRHPYEAKPWYIYRKIFLTDERIKKGIIYWRYHATTLTRARKTFGVPASIIVAIVGVER